jgi:hypothetical protein
LFDIADLVKTTDPSAIVDPAFAAWSAADPSVTPENLNIPNLPSPYILGQHYFITNHISGTGLSAKWDFTFNVLAEKQYAGRFSNEFVEARRGGYIGRVVRYPVARYTRILTAVITS